MKSTRRWCTLCYGEKGATKQRRARLIVQSACKGHGFMDKASRKGYNQTREQVNDSMDVIRPRETTARLE